MLETAILIHAKSTSAPVKQHFFERGELIPLENSVLWRIERGIVCASTWDEDGKSTILGYWGIGDIVGYPLSKVQPYHLECLNATEATIVSFEVLHQNIDALLSGHLASRGANMYCQLQAGIYPCVAIFAVVKQQIWS